MTRHHSKKSHRRKRGYLSKITYKLRKSKWFTLILALLLMHIIPAIGGIVLGIYLINRINKIDLSNDLNLGLLNVFAFIMICLGLSITMIGICSEPSTLDVLNIAIPMCCFIAVGLFSRFRASRRYQMIKIW